MSISTTPKPRGRSRWRSGPFAAGSVSVRTTTSRSISARRSARRACASAGRSAGRRGCRRRRRAGGRPRAARRASAAPRLGVAASAASAGMRPCAAAGSAAASARSKATTACMSSSPVHRDKRIGAGLREEMRRGGEEAAMSELDDVAGAGAARAEGARAREPDLGDARGDRGQAALHRGRPRGARRISAACRGCRPTPAGRGRRCMPGGRGRSGSTPASRRPRRATPSTARRWRRGSRG